MHRSTRRAAASEHSGTKEGDAPVFHDPSGHRTVWWRALAITTLVLIAAWLGLYVMNAAVTPHITSPAGVEAITADEAGRAAPVVGTGPLERVVKVAPQVASEGAMAGFDPYTGARVATFTGADAATIGRAPYAIQRYGYYDDAHRTISLTFDDGPDAAVTPQLLDVLSREKVPATFFLVGRNIVRNKAIVERLSREGHAVGVHTLTHPDLNSEPSWRERAELLGTERIIRDVTGHAATVWRMPYTSPVESLEQESIGPFLYAQQLGYTHASYDFDTNDWEHDARLGGSANDIPLPDLSAGTNVTLLLHDAGGPGRERTVEYVQRLIPYARAHGYTFTTMPQANPAIAEANTPARATWVDTATTALATAVFAAPSRIMYGLFLFAVLAVVVFGLVNASLAIIRHRRRARTAWPDPADIRIPTSVVIAAYNEEAVIGRTIRSVLASEYPIRELIIVNDGSTDATAEVVAAIAGTDPRVMLVNKANSGKAHTLNLGVGNASGDVVVTLDADTLLAPATVTHLVRHFVLDDATRQADPRRRPLGAVAGVVRVGNRRRNLLTRWQALEYVTQIGLERSSQDAIGGIAIIPGACAAWRREAILGAGGYNTTTLAEDCDLALTMHRHGWQITQDDDAIAYTEVPENVDDLLKQRSRWTYGIMQAMWKNRDLMFDRSHPALGWYVLPNYIISIVVPLAFIPFVLLMAFATLQDEGPALLLAYFGLFLAIQFALAALAVRLMREDYALLLMVPIYRVAFEPMRAYLLYTCVQRALEGRTLGWNKLARTAAMDTEHDLAGPTGSPALTGATATTQEDKA